jgi:hypothetical protein
MTALLEVFTHVFDEGHWFAPGPSMIEWFLDYYAALAEHITVCVDTGSTDDTLDLCRSYGSQVSVERWQTDGEDDTAFVRLASQRIAQSKAVYAAWPDVDEFICSRGLFRGELEAHAQAGHMLLQAGRAFAMFSETFPTSKRLFDELKLGVEDPSYGPKPIIVSPRMRVFWLPGKHGLLEPHAPVVVEPRWQYRHARYLGMDYNAARNARNWERVPAGEKAKGHGIHCAPENDAQQRAWFAQSLKLAVNVDEVQE